MLDTGQNILSAPSALMTVRLTSQTYDLNVKVFVKVFKTLLFPNLITYFIHVSFDDTYLSKILCSTIHTILGHVKVKVTDLEFFDVKILRQSF